MEILKDELDRLLGTMIESAQGISDLLFVAGRHPQLEVHGHLESYTPVPVLDNARIEGIAKAIMNGNPKLAEDLAKAEVHAIAVMRCRPVTVSV